MALLGWTRRQMSEAIEAGEVELWTTPVGKWFPRAEMMAKALETWPLHVIEEALGARRMASSRRPSPPRSCASACRGITSTCWSTGPASEQRDHGHLLRRSPPECGAQSQQGTNERRFADG